MFLSRQIADYRRLQSTGQQGSLRDKRINAIDLARCRRAIADRRGRSEELGVAILSRHLGALILPACLPGVIAVAAESLQSLPARVYGAPGRDVPTTQPGGKWYLVNGSSYAVAHVSGLIALLRQADGRSSRVALVRGAGGTVDACATLVGASPGCDCSCGLDRRLSRQRH